MKGQDGELAIGRDIVNPGSYDLGGVDFLFSCIVRCDDVSDAHYSHLLGRFYILDALVEDFPAKFTADQTDDASTCFECDDVMCVHEQHSASAGAGDRHHSQTATCRCVATLKFSKAHLNYAHAKVKSFARRLFLVVARLQMRNDDLFRRVVSFLDDVDVNLQVHLRRRLLQSNEDVNSDVSPRLERGHRDNMIDDDSDPKRQSGASSADTSTDAQTSSTSSPRTPSPMQCDDVTPSDAQKSPKYVCKLTRTMSFRGERSCRVTSRIEPIDEDSSVNTSDVSDGDDVTDDVSVLTQVQLNTSNASSTATDAALESPCIDEDDVIMNPLVTAFERLAGPDG